MPILEDLSGSATGSVHIGRYKVEQARMREISRVDTVDPAVARV